MQRVKNIQNLSELQNCFQKTDILSQSFHRLLSQFHLGSIYKILDRCKSKGVDPCIIFETLFLFPFIGILNIRCLVLSGFSPELSGSKDAYYSFINNARIDWRKIVYLFARQFNRIVRKHSVDDQIDSPRCIIVDDSVLEKSGKKIEWIGKVFDHCTHSYKLGMKMLMLGFWDGKSFIPLDFSIHHEAGKKKNRGLKGCELKNQYSKIRDHQDPSFQRSTELSKSKMEVGIEMIHRAIKNGFVPQYVLADSWFIGESFIRAVQGLKRKNQIHLIGLMKLNRIIQLNGKSYKASTLASLLRNQIKTSRKLKSSYIPFCMQYKGLSLKAFLVRIHGQQTWKLLITTDHSLSFVKTMQLYQVRWSIEVFFKDAKQHLYLGKCQSNDFDAHLATLSFSLMNYMVLALGKRFESYESLGQMFIAFRDFLLEATLVKKLWQLIVEIYYEVLAEYGVDWELFIRKIIHLDQSSFVLRNCFNFLLLRNNHHQKISLY